MPTCMSAGLLPHTCVSPTILPACVQGALVANYPWDGTPDQSTQYQASPDDDTFKHLAQLYATTHRIMSSPDNPVGGRAYGSRG